MPKFTSERKAALITGGAQRIGQGIALMLADLGYDIALHYSHSRSQAQSTALALEKKNVRCTLFQCDLADEDSTGKLVKSAAGQFPHLNLLVNNASIFEKSKFRSQDLPLLNRHFAVNLRAPFLLSCDFFALCKRGQIINILDTNIVKNKTSHVAYLLTKKSLADMTKLAAVEFAPQVRVNGIAPGLILPPAEENPEYLDRMAKNIPLRRKGSIAYIAQSVRFLIENDFLTGQFIFNDGGEHLI